MEFLDINTNKKKKTETLSTSIYFALNETFRIWLESHMLDHSYQVHYDNTLICTATSLITFQTLDEQSEHTLRDV